MDSVCYAGAACRHAHGSQELRSRALVPGEEGSSLEDDEQELRIGLGNGHKDVSRFTAKQAKAESRRSTVVGHINSTASASTTRDPQAAAALLRSYSTTTNATASFSNSNLSSAAAAAAAVAVPSMAPANRRRAHHNSSNSSGTQTKIVLTAGPAAAGSGTVQTILKPPSCENVNGESTNSTSILVHLSSNSNSSSSSRQPTAVSAEKSPSSIDISSSNTSRRCLSAIALTETTSASLVDDPAAAGPSATLVPTTMTPDEETAAAEEATGEEKPSHGPHSPELQLAALQPNTVESGVSAAAAAANCQEACTVITTASVAHAPLSVDNNTVQLESLNIRTTVFAAGGSSACSNESPASSVSAVTRDDLALSHIPCIDVATGTVLAAETPLSSSSSETETEPLRILSPTNTQLLLRTSTAPAMSLISPTMRGQSPHEFWAKTALSPRQRSSSSLQQQQQPSPPPQQSYWHDEFVVAPTTGNLARSNSCSSSNSPNHHQQQLLNCNGLSPQARLPNAEGLAANQRQRAQLYGNGITNGLPPSYPGFPVPPGTHRSVYRQRGLSTFGPPHDYCTEAIRANAATRMYPSPSFSTGAMMSGAGRSSAGLTLQQRSIDPSSLTRSFTTTGGGDLLPSRSFTELVNEHDPVTTVSNDGTMHSALLRPLTTGPWDLDADSTTRPMNGSYWLPTSSYEFSQQQQQLRNSGPYRPLPPPLLKSPSHPHPHPHPLPHTLINRSSSLCFAVGTSTPLSQGRSLAGGCTHGHASNSHKRKHTMSVVDMHCSTSIPPSSTLETPLQHQYQYEEGNLRNVNGILMTPTGQALTPTASHFRCSSQNASTIVATTVRTAPTPPPLGLEQGESARAIWNPFLESSAQLSKSLGEITFAPVGSAHTQPHSIAGMSTISTCTSNNVVAAAAAADSVSNSAAAAESFAAAPGRKNSYGLNGVAVGGLWGTEWSGFMSDLIRSQSASSTTAFTDCSTAACSSNPTFDIQYAPRSSLTAIAPAAAHASTD